MNLQHKSKTVFIKHDNTEEDLKSLKSITKDYRRDIPINVRWLKDNILITDEQGFNNLIEGEKYWSLIAWDENRYVEFKEDDFNKIDNPELEHLEYKIEIL